MKFPWSEFFRYLSLITGIGVLFISAVLLGWFLGTLLSQHFGGMVWLIAGLVMGVIAGFVSVWTTLKKFIPWE